MELCSFRLTVRGMLIVFFVGLASGTGRGYWGGSARVGLGGVYGWGHRGAFLHCRVIEPRITTAAHYSPFLVIRFKVGHGLGEGEGGTDSTGNAEGTMVLRPYSGKLEQEERGFNGQSDSDAVALWLARAGRNRCTMERWYLSNKNLEFSNPMSLGVFSASPSFICPAAG